MFKWQIRLDRHGPRPLSNIASFPTPLGSHFLLPIQDCSIPRAPADAAAPELAPVRTAEVGPWGLGAAACAGLAPCVRLGSPPPWSRPFRNLIIGV